MTDPTRRRVLAGLGAAAVASLSGCSLLETADDEPPRFSSTDVETILSTSISDPQRPAPVTLSTSALDDGLNRCSELIDTVPESISVEQIPNGAIRDEIATLRSDAVDARDAVRDESRPFDGLLALREARETAREAATAYAAVQNDLVRDVEAARREARTAVGTRLAQVGYAGDDRGRTLLVAYRIEQSLLDARRRVNRGFRTPAPTVLDVGELAGDVEYAAATLGASDTIAQRHTATVDEPTDFTAQTSAALETTLRSLSRADLPDADTTAQEVFGQELTRPERQYLFQEALRGVNRWRDDLSSALTAGRFASGIDHAIRLERDARALDTVIQRIDDDDVPELASVDPIRDEREAAIEAAEAIPVSPTEPSLASDVVARSLQRLVWIDRELELYIQRDTESRLQREYARYVYLRAQFEALPTAIEAVRDRIDRWSTSAWA
jgi:hypothetical protein